MFIGEEMKVAVIGSRGLSVERLEDYLPEGVTELVSGGAKGIDTCVRIYAEARGVRLTEFLPQYHRYGKAAPILRNRQIVRYADCVIAFWDGSSRGTQNVIRLCESAGKQVTVYRL